MKFLPLIMLFQQWAILKAGFSRYTKVASVLTRAEEELSSGML